jgi:putative transposase
MAYAQHRPDEVIHHSDHGGEYTAVAFSTRCRELGIMRSMGSVGDCFDNAMIESFFSSLEAEVLELYRFQTRDAPAERVSRGSRGWYNPHRRHSGLGYVFLTC